MGVHSLAVAGLIVRIEADNEAWLDHAIAAVLGPFLLSHHPPADVVLRVRCAPPTVELVGSAVISVSSPGALACVAEEQVWRALVDRTTHKPLLHAAGLARNGRAVVAPGASHAGKSTLALALLARGPDFLSDDIVPVDVATGCAVPVPRLLHLRPATLALLPDALECIRIVDVPCIDASGRPVMLAAPRATLALAARPVIAAIVFPRLSPSGPCLLTAVRPSLAAIQLMDHTMNRGTLASIAFTAALDIAHHIPCFDFAVNDPREAAAALDQLLA